MTQETDQSIFNKQDNANNNNSQTAELTSEELRFVGEGKKYKDVKELDKAYANADTFIEQLKQDSEDKRQTIESLTAELEKRKSAEEVAEALRKSKSGGDSTKSSISADDITKLIQDTVPQVLSAKERETRQANNLTSFQAKMREAFGSEEKADEVIKQRAAESGLTVGQIVSLAQSSPAAALKIAGVEGTSKSTVPVPATKSDVTTPPSNSEGDETQWSYWQKMRRANPTLYHSPQMSMKRHNLVGQGKLNPQQ